MPARRDQLHACAACLHVSLRKKHVSPVVQVFCEVVALELVPRRLIVLRHATPRLSDLCARVCFVHPQAAREFGVHVNCDSAEERIFVVQPLDSHTVRFDGVENPAGEVHIL